jgi:hypothetical protein
MDEDWIRELDLIIDVFPSKVLSKIIVNYLMEADIEFECIKNSQLTTDSKKVTCLQYSPPYLMVNGRHPMSVCKKTFSFMHSGEPRADVIVSFCTNNQPFLYNYFGGRTHVHGNDFFVKIDVEVLNDQRTRITTTQIHKDPSKKQYTKSVSVTYCKWKSENLISESILRFGVGWLPQNVEIINDMSSYIDPLWPIIVGEECIRWSVVIAFYDKCKLEHACK